jgi:hypothetical protein
MKNLRFISQQDIVKVMTEKGYKIFDAEGIPNIVGVRSAETDGEDFDDICYVWWTLPNGKPEIHLYTITTNPGTYYLKNPLSGTKGTGILVPDQYVDCWELGMHRGKQLALLQTGGPVSVFRDSNRDGKMDYDPTSIQKGYFGVNLHHASLSDLDTIGLWSAACQVWKFHKPHEELMLKFKDLSNRYKFKKFSYTLLEQKDFKEAS